ncbi:ParB/RepB/Spo0J family partition protein [Aetokthonos hydrillicola Thurmond2011]|jgi:ParB family chromosome partitioning protein|uniref:ParB/RepB/Spo0J family partition protein n=1 Tax=Aetokthonos hydrillicola Thurmond2011 TaxID=2712845 RepID=A0AAP5MBD1_9CYAN|nr:ParB/RepB/Spo0J family partition protein [Aetokthonos hydrillicola]MBO3458485.1 ParB N-terminal domain-containing protein [Aetokthonos hydrillicola CCALA 1050]MBW4586188.1 ParB/RepB/Spo0J family partition protein [Aetokthonos hydrillicola CCALA 1050]MDR9897797.1 ParB/RepB/Spo0J family partition protein [Aetokthonos hydrillicola Thurmond2011]
MAARKPIEMKQLFSEAGQSQQIHQLKGQIEELEAELAQLRSGMLNAKEKAALEQQIKDLTDQLAYSGGVHEIELQRIQPDPDQPRQTFPPYQIQERAESLRRNGQKTPIVLIPQTDEDYILFDGELRWRAAQSIGWNTLKAVFLPKEQILAAEEVFEGQLVTSIHSQKLHDLDLATSLVKLIVYKYPDLKERETEIPKILNTGITQLRRGQKHLELNQIRLAEQVDQQEWLETAGFKKIEELEVIAVLLGLQLNPISINNNIFPLISLAEDLKQVIRQEGLESSKAREINKLSALQLEVDEAKALVLRKEITQKAIQEKLSLSDIKRLVNDTLAQYSPKKTNQANKIIKLSKTIQDFQVQTAEKEELMSLQQILVDKLAEIEQALKQ